MYIYILFFRYRLHYKFMIKFYTLYIYVYVKYLYVFFQISILFKMK